MKNKNGFTLVELMTAAMLAGIILVIALPFLILGMNAMGLAGKVMEISVEGDAIFEYLSGELQNADGIWVGSRGEEPPESGKWDVLYDGKEKYVLHVQDLGLSGVLLSVVYEENGKILYEREEVLWTVTLASDSNAKNRWNGQTLWYQKRTERH